MRTDTQTQPKWTIFHLLFGLDFHFWFILLFSLNCFVTLLSLLWSAIRWSFMGGTQSWTARARLSDHSQYLGIPGKHVRDEKQLQCPSVCRNTVGRTLKQVVYNSRTCKDTDALGNWVFFGYDSWWCFCHDCYDGRMAWW